MTRSYPSSLPAQPAEDVAPADDYCHLAARRDYLHVSVGRTLSEQRHRVPVPSGPPADSPLSFSSILLYFIAIICFMMVTKLAKNVP
ncbi:MAG: hypothetical protein MZV63_44300 [Marinilabiliales bacterium]|nr:hypothetical protein [Marinilabiliales bacterium]